MWRILAVLLFWSCGSDKPAEQRPGAPSVPKIENGLNADLGGFLPFGSSSSWNRDISQDPVDPLSDTYLGSEGLGFQKFSHADFGTTWEGAPNGLPYFVVAGAPLVPIRFRAYASESDPGPYPLPTDLFTVNQIIQGGGESSNNQSDRHVIVLDQQRLKLYELWQASFQGGVWSADSGAIFDLTRDSSRPKGWTSADAAGLPIFPGLARYDEVVTRGEIRHALRFTALRTQAGYVAPANHSAGQADPHLPPMGLRVRMKQSYSCASFSRPVRVICAALKKYGMILADNGTPWAIAGAPDPRWDDDALHDLTKIPGSAFEAVAHGPITAQDQFTSKRTLVSSAFSTCRKPLLRP